jgi:GTP-binding protein
MIVTQARFISSVISTEACPPDKYPEYAFIGRSNVGKSSLVNFITGIKKLAKISVRPGKTQTINHFLVNEEWYLADLPGYGFAKVPVHIKDKWDLMISSFLKGRKNLLTVFVLIDIRHEPLNIDLEFIHWLGNNQLPFAMVFTKADKLSVTKAKGMIEKYNHVLRKTWHTLPPVFISSVLAKTGREPILEFIHETNKIFSQSPEEPSV